MFGICKLHECPFPAAVGPDGSPSEYCSFGHQLSVLLSGEADSSSRVTKELYKSQYIDRLLATYSGSWEANPYSATIWKIHCDRAQKDQFVRYQSDVERTSHVPGGNTQRLWHGTMRKCTVGDTDRSGFCSDASCGVCNIMRTSFRVARAGQRFGFRRFGAGIYTTATSSKANDYVVEAGGSRFRAMLLSEVVLGRVSRMSKGDGTLTQPPAGYDSVVGEPGEDLNYDEVVVYKNEAIRPIFLVIYKP